MTVATSTSKSGPYAGAGTTGPFTVGFRFLENSHLAVVRTSTAGVESTLVLDSAYTVTGAGALTGTVTLAVALAVGEKLTITRNVPVTQEADYVQNDAFPAESHERALDKLTMLIQQQAEEMGRTIKLPVSVDGVSPLMPVPSPNNMIAWNAAADGLQNLDPTALATIVAFGTANADIFTGDGVTTAYTLSANPGAQANLDVSIGGVTQLPVTDYVWLGGTAVTFTSAPALGVKVLVRYFQALPQGVTDSAAADYQQEGVGSVGRNVQERLREQASLFDFLTAIQIVEYQARTAQSNFAAALDLTAPIQQAIYTTYAAGKNLYLPPGAAKIIGTLEVPTNTALYEDRGDAWTMYGQGASQTFVRSNYKGTVLVSQSNAPILRYVQRRAMPTSSANYVLHGIRFEQQSALCTQPVVLLDSCSEYAAFHHNQIYQAGTGDGLKISAHIKGEIRHNFIMNRDWLAGHVTGFGIGINIASGWDSGLLTLEKNTSRGFQWGQVIGDGVNDPSGTLLIQNEASMCNNGTWIRALVTACTLFKPYYEGIRSTCVVDDGTMSTVDGGMFYTGFAIGIDSSSFTYGNRYVSNYMETAGAQPCTLVKIASGGNTKTVSGNHLLFSNSGGVVPGVVGIAITGTTAQFAMVGNAFLPRGRWIGGAGTAKVTYSANNNNAGFTLTNNIDQEFPMLAQGAISLARQTAALTQADVAAGVLTLAGGSNFVMTATVATNVNVIDGLTDNDRLVYLRLTNANTTLVRGAQFLMSANHTGPGLATILTQNIGATKFAYLAAWEAH